MKYKKEPFFSNESYKIKLVATYIMGDDEGEKIYSSEFDNITDELLEICYIINKILKKKYSFQFSSKNLKKFTNEKIITLDEYQTIINIGPGEDNETPEEELQNKYPYWCLEEEVFYFTETEHSYLELRKLELIEYANGEVYRIIPYKEE